MTAPQLEVSGCGMGHQGGALLLSPPLRLWAPRCFCLTEQLKAPGLVRILWLYEKSDDLLDRNQRGKELSKWKGHGKHLLSLGWIWTAGKTDARLYKNREFQLDLANVSAACRKKKPQLLAIPLSHSTQLENNWLWLNSRPSPPSHDPLLPSLSLLSVSISSAYPAHGATAKTSLSRRLSLPPSL